MADDKKNIPDAGKVNEPAKAENTEPMKAEPAVPEQPAPSKPETPAVEDAPKAAVPPVAEKAPTPGAEQPAPSKQDNPKGKDKPTPPKEDKPQPGKTDQQVTIPGMGDPAPAGKVVDFIATRDGATKGKPPEKAAAPDKDKQADKAKDAAKPRRGRPVRMTRRPPTRPSRSFGARTVNMAAFGGVPIPLRRSVCVCLHLTAEHQGVVSKRPETETAVLYR